MNNWRRRGEFHQQHQDFHGSSSNSRKSHQGKWHPTVPSWEKKFCYVVGSVPWRKLLETKRYMDLHENVVKWNDSAVEEAFHNAKTRFWAEMNGQICNISLPDPDIYIDKIDWDAGVDRELILDLEREPKESDLKDRGEQVVIMGNLLVDQSFGIGWGDAEDYLKNAASSKMDLGSWGNDQNAHNNEVPAIQTGESKVYSHGWESGWNDTLEKENNYDSWGYGCDQRNHHNEWDSHHNQYDGNWDTWDNNHHGNWDTWDNNHHQNRQNTTWQMSRYKTTRFQSNYGRMDRSWWKNQKGSGRGENFVC